MKLFDENLARYILIEFEIGENKQRVNYWISKSASKLFVVLLKGFSIFMKTLDWESSIEILKLAISF
jgi:hypothetical protein